MFFVESWGSGKKGGMTENQDIGNGYIGNPIYPGLKSIYSYKMDIWEIDTSEMDISEMDLGTMAISEFQFIHSYKNGHIGNGFRCYGYIGFPINP
jgi:hypothetical protein